MHPFRQGFEVERLQFFFQKIFNRFHIVIGDAFNVFDLRGIFRGKLIHRFAQRLLLRCSELEKFILRQKDEVFHFNLQAIAEEGVLGKKGRQFCGLMLISSVDGGDGKQGVLHTAKVMDVCTDAWNWLLCFHSLAPVTFALPCKIKYPDIELVWSII